MRAKSVTFQSRPCKQQRDRQAWLLFCSNRGGSMGEREQQVVLLSAHHFSLMTPLAPALCSCISTCVTPSTHQQLGCVSGLPSDACRMRLLLCSPTGHTHMVPSTIHIQPVAGPHKCDLQHHHLKHLLALHLLPEHPAA